MKKILFVTYGGGHAHMVYPIVHELKKTKDYVENKIDISVLGLTSAGPILKRNGVQSFGFSHYLNSETDRDALLWGEKLAQKHHSDKSGISKEESIAYLGLSFKDLVLKLGLEKARLRFEEKGRQAFFPTSVLERIINDLSPDFVVATNSPRAEAAAIEVANKKGIETLIMTDLFSLMPGYKLKAKHISFFNEIAQEMLLEDKAIDSKISSFYYTGNPAFDRLLNSSLKKDKGWMRQSFPKVCNKKVVLHADMPAYWHPLKKDSYFKTEEDNLRELEACYQAAMDNNAVYLVRPHPSQANDFYLQWLKGRKDAYLASSCDLHTLLKNVDALIVRTSTVGLEACYLGTTVVQLDCDFHTDLPLTKMGIAFGARNYLELGLVLKNALQQGEKGQKEEKSEFKTLPREMAAGKIVSVILDNLK